MLETRDRVVTVAMAAVMVFAAVAPSMAEGEGGAVQDPPGLVGRIARISGSVSYHGDGATQWEQAQVNYPISSGAAVWTQPSSSVDLDVGPNRVTLDQGTEFDVESLTDQQFTSVAPQGRVYLRVRDVPAGQQMELRTPRGTVILSRAGRYEIVAGDTQSPTQVTVQEGLAQVTGPGVSLAVGPRQTAQITGDDVFQGRVGPEVSDGFLAEQVARDQPTQFARRYDPPPVVQQMTGYDAVAETGEWTASAEYGRVWYPPVEHGWVPYRHGHWAFVAPWGWTWVDDAPWGFAPFHYGRWVEIDDRWAWTPVVPGYVERARPVYAPALVAFVGLGVGVGIGVGLGASVGWIPLGPREVYRPPYQVSNNYVRNVNITNVTNVTNITNTTTNISNTRYVNNRAATLVPQTALTQSQPVARLARPVSAQALATAQPLAQVPVQPTRATRGVTPAVAQSLNLPAGPVPAAAPRPGPPIRSFGAPAASPAAPSAGASAGAGAGVTGAIAGQRAGLPPMPGAGRQAAPGAAVTSVPSVSPAPAPAPAVQPASVPVQTFTRPTIRPPGGLSAPGPGLPVPAQGRPAPAQPVSGQPGQVQPGQLQQGPGQPGQGQPGQGQPGQGQPVAVSVPVPGQVARPAQPQQGLSQPAQPQQTLAQPGAVSAPAPGQPVIPRPATLAPAIPPSGGYARPAIPPPSQGSGAAAAPLAPRPVQPASAPPVAQRPVQPAPAVSLPPIAQRPAVQTPAPQPQFRPQSQPQPQFHPQPQPQPQPQFHPQPQPQPQPQFHPQPQPQPQVQHQAPPPAPPQAQHRQCPPNRPNC